MKLTSYSTTSGVNGSVNDALKLTAAVGAKRGTSVNTLNFAVTAAVRQPMRHAMPRSPPQTYTSMATLATAIQNCLKTANAFGTVTGGAVANVDVAVYDTNKLRFFTYDEGSDYKLQHNTTGVASEQAMTVLGMTPDTLANSGTDALVSFDSYTTAITSVKYAATSNVTLYNKASGVAGRGSVNPHHWHRCQWP